MTDGLPIDGLRAEVESWPFISRTAFRRGMTHLELDNDRVLSGHTKDMWIELEEHLRLRAGRSNLAELTPLRDAAWFSVSKRTVPGVHQGRVPLSHYLTHLAKATLRTRGSFVTLRPAEVADVASTRDVVERWRWLSICLPPELLVAASGHRGEPNVVLSPSALSRSLKNRPVAQQHLHLGAGPSISALWSALTMETSLPRRIDGDPPLENFEAVLVAAGFARRILLEHVGNRALGLTTSLEETLVRFASECSRRRGRSPYEWRRDFERLLRQLLDPTAPPEAPAWAARCRARVPSARFEYAHPELLRRCFDELATNAYEPRFGLLFLQYVRAYAVTYRHLVQDPSSCGLDWFTRHYDRIGPMTAQEIRARQLTETLRNDGAELRLESLEIRTRPDLTWHQVGEQVRDFAKQVATWSSPSPAEWGITFHLIKRNEMPISGERKQRSGDVGPGGRYARWFNDGARRIRALEHLLRRRPEVLAVVRGIDVANVELAIPTWIVAPLLTRLRTSSRAVAREVASRRGIGDLGEVRVVPHIGEDYRRLSEGLRRIGEALAAGVLGQRSRIGHGLALGTDPTRWCDQHPVVYQPLEERLFDLLWELTQIDAGVVAHRRGRTRQVKAEALALGKLLFAERALSIDRLIDNYCSLLDPVGVDRRFGYGSPARSTDRPIGYAERWLFDRAVYLRGLQPIAVTNLREEADVYSEMQRGLARELAVKEITVECNPSSNLLVGGLATFRQHPMFRLQPLDLADDAQRVSVSLNSDDPISFATRLVDEYAYAYHAIISSAPRSNEAKEVRRNALQWLDRVRRLGWAARITLPASRDPAVLDRLVGARHKYS